ncbi:MAG: hypothetical protein JSU59_06380 [Nitrospirota bacterium]|nr:MAG: hypothetical protein JSU59_06380 [Nitrospirota bacterium]
MPESSKHAEEIPPKSRLVLGAAIFLTGSLSPLLVPLVATSELSTAWKTGISGLLLFGIPELALLTAIGILGKTGFNYLKSKLFGFFKKYGPPEKVSPTRYRVGLVLFVLPILVGWLLPYGAHLLSFYPENRVLVNVALDLLFISSVFVLGGDFWDKIQSLFIQEARVQFPTTE